jgi:peroxisomal membrane protein 4
MQNKHNHIDLLSSLRGLRNGIITGIRIRLPYVFQGIIYAILFRNQTVISRVSLLIKQMFLHGCNLGLFVLIYKFLCSVFRSIGITGGIESWIAGFIGGFYAFGDSRGISGSVNNQIVLYLFARGFEGALRLLVKKGYISSQFDIRKGLGFRIFAGFSLALILYLTEYQPEVLRPAFMSTMDYIYYESEAGPIFPRYSIKFAPFLA